MKRIKAIYDNEYGCEERQPDEKLKYIVVLADENGNEEEIIVEDEYLTEMGLDEGSLWPEE